MNEECLICKAPLEYLEADTMMECVICHKKENSKTRCVNGHYVCCECHPSGMDEIIALALNEKSKNPTRILEKMMSMDFCHMYGPEHHVMVGVHFLLRIKTQAVILICRLHYPKCMQGENKFPVEHADFGAPAVQVSAQECICRLQQSQHRLQAKLGGFPIK